MAALMRARISRLRTGFTVTLDPPEETMMALDPHDRTQVTLTPSLVDSGQTGLLVVEACLEMGGGNRVTAAA